MFFLAKDMHSNIFNMPEITTYEYDFVVGRLAA